jgi:hypothetical protein
MIFFVLTIRPFTEPCDAQVSNVFQPRMVSLEGQEWISDSNMVVQDDRSIQMRQCESFQPLRNLT